MILKSIGRVSWLRRVSLLLAFTIFSQGCSTIQLPKYEAIPLKNHELSQKKNGLVVGFQPMIDRKKVITYFGSDLLALDLLPIFVVAENKNQTTSFIVSRDSFSLMNDNNKLRGIQNAFEKNLAKPRKKKRPKGRGIKPKLRNKQSGRGMVGSESAGQSIMMLGALLAPIGMILFWPSASKMISDANEVRYNFEVQEMQTQTLSPGESASGFMYLELPPAEENREKWAVRLKITELKNRNITEFDFTFPWKRSKNETRKLQKSR